MGVFNCPVTVVDGVCVHRIWFKCLLNPVLRKIQFWSNRPYVIISHIENNICIGYGFQQTALLKVKLEK